MAVRRATAADLPGVAATLARAFAPFDFVRAALPGDRYAERLHDLYELFGELALCHGELWTVDDRAAAAMWQPPGCDPEPDADTAARLAALLGAGVERYAAAEELGERHRPAGPHWYLDVLGTAPDRRRRGLASAVLAPVLARCDAGGLPAVTDTSAAENLAFYIRHGFTVTSEYDEPDGGPHVWVLGRPPGASRGPQ